MARESTIGGGLYRIGEGLTDIANAILQNRAARIKAATATVRANTRRLEDAVAHTEPVTKEE